jgi:predicted short-subunit dehydrogenase-like oxidoreductase (DUF2520 family)
VSHRSTVAIIGAGNLASALANALHEANYRVTIITRDRAASLRRARLLATRVDAEVSTLNGPQFRTDVLWLCVNDAAIASLARALSDQRGWSAKVVIHSSGALSSELLAPLRARGAAVASAHPMMTFVCDSRPNMRGVWWGIEGDAAAVRTARAIVRRLGGNVLSLNASDKALYHAWGAFSSPLLVALLAAAERVAAAGGVSRRRARQVMAPIVERTVANYLSHDAAKAFSGPLPRGDVATVRQHLRALKQYPELNQIYRALVQVALRELPVKKAAAIARLLQH